MCVCTLAVVRHWHRLEAVMIVAVMERLCNHWWVERLWQKGKEEEASSRGCNAMEQQGKILADTKLGLVAQNSIVHS